jgi:RNA polymerase sigma-70 factor (sigma-E family)
MQAILRSAPPVGDPVRLADFASMHTVGLTRFAYLICGDRGLAEDLVQDAFVALYRRFGEVLPIDAPLAYARRSIVNGNTSHGRRRMNSETALSDLPDGPDAAVDAVDHGEQDAMWRVLATLPERQRAVLVLRYYLDLPDHEIADALGCREGTVRSIAARAFAALRRHPDITSTGTPEETS